MNMSVRYIGIVLFVLLWAQSCRAQNECQNQGLQTIWQANDSQGVLHQMACFDPGTAQVSFPKIKGNITNSGTATFTGAMNINSPGTLTNSQTGTFTNTQSNEYMTSALGGINIATEFSSLQGGAHQTDAIAGGVNIPVGATVVGANGLAGYAVTSADSASRTRGNAVPIYGQCRNAANNSACWGSNTVVFDAAGLTGHNMSGYELDMNLLGSPAYFKGFYVTGLNQGGTLPAAATGFEIQTPYQLPNGFICDRGSCNIGLQLADQSTANPSSSQIIQLISHTAAGVANIWQMSETSAGDLSIISGAGRGVTLPGVAFASLPSSPNGTIIFCTDCNATCTAGAGTGRTCFRENGAWTH